MEAEWVAIMMSRCRDSVEAKAGVAVALVVPLVCACHPHFVLGCVLSAGGGGGGGDGGSGSGCLLKKCHRKVMVFSCRALRCGHSINATNIVGIKHNVPGVFFTMSGKARTRCTFVLHRVPTSIGIKTIGKPGFSEAHTGLSRVRCTSCIKQPSTTRQTS